MVRRDFLAGIAGSVPAVATTASAQQNRPTFRLRYGPHPGMFQNSAGDDIIDQIKFAADQGFTAWEDNGAMGRSPELNWCARCRLRGLRMRGGEDAATHQMAQ